MLVSGCIYCISRQYDFFYFIPICKILQLKGGILKIGYRVILKCIYLCIFFIFLSSVFCDSSLSLKETSCSNTNTHLINYPGNWLHSDRMSLLTAPEMKASTLIGIFTSYFLSLMFSQRICWSGGRFPKMFHLTKRVFKSIIQLREAEKGLILQLRGELQLQPSTL